MNEEQIIALASPVGAFLPMFRFCRIFAVTNQIFSHHEENFALNDSDDHRILRIG